MITADLWCICDFDLGRWNHQAGYARFFKATSCDSSVSSALVDITPELRPLDGYDIVLSQDALTKKLIGS